MPLTPVRYRRRGDVVDVVGRGQFGPARDAAVVLPLDILRDASLNDLRRALDALQNDAHIGGIYFTEAPWEDYDPDTSPSQRAGCVTGAARA